MEALGINLGYLISQIVNFTLLALLLYFVAYKPVLRMLDERSARINKGIQDAEQASRRAAEMEQEFERQMADARREGQEIVAQATQASERAGQEILERAREESRAQIERAKEEISRERDLAMADLRRQVAELSLTISEKVLGETLDEQSQRRLIAEFLEQTEELK
ncbi:MAG: F0F1 ATP synthase subunit B [Anaerolineae bacterium]|nr:F0F1 ATP synthase subunit B [Anaerolineae bacterium]MDX9829949.1 F0F1 ATP synthase subunit B [Anaerolineae bacterium]